MKDKFKKKKQKETQWNLQQETHIIFLANSFSNRNTSGWRAELEIVVNQEGTEVSNYVNIYIYICVKYVIYVILYVKRQGP
jgi:hypothetical protein